MKYFSFIVLCLLLMASCQDVKRSEKPEDLIPEDKMVNVLTEMSLLQGARSYSKQELERRGIKPDEYLWEKFDIDSARFANSNNYYSENYVVYQRIYEKVKDSLETLKSHYDSIRELEEEERDSIIEAKRARGDTIIEEEQQARRPLDSIMPDTFTRSLPEVPRRQGIRQDSF